VVLILLLVFVLQNSRTVAIHFLGLSGHLSLAVALLLAAVLGVLLVAIPGTARIIQLRRSVKRARSLVEIETPEPALTSDTPTHGRDSFAAAPRS
jgi:uncharacterized integral membrane protein